MFNILFTIMLALNGVVFFSLMFVIFVAFQLSHHINGFRLFIYIVGLLTGLHIVLLSFQVKGYSQ